jgi:hypothetical protein
MRNPAGGAAECVAITGCGPPRLSGPDRPAQLPPRTVVIRKSTADRLWHAPRSAPAVWPATRRRLGPIGDRSRSSSARWTSSGYSRGSTAFACNWMPNGSHSYPAATAGSSGSMARTSPSTRTTHGCSSSCGPSAASGAIRPATARCARCSRSTSSGMLPPRSGPSAGADPAEDILKTSRPGPDKRPLPRARARLPVTGRDLGLVPESCPPLRLELDGPSAG